MSFASKYIETGKKLGSGQYGTAFLVKSKETGQLLVMKRFTTRLESSELKYARGEVIALQKLNHPNVVRYHDSNENPAQFSIVMEYASGGTLGAEIAVKKNFVPPIPFSDLQVFKWGGQLLSAIDYIHQQKVMHRDIKPDNVFLSAEKDVKLGDFGVVKMTDADSLKGGTLMGTPAYMALDIFMANEAHQTYSYKVDEWSAGIVIFELSTLQRPFTAKDINELIKNLQMRKFAVSLSAVKNKEIFQIVEGLLIKDPKTRLSAREALDKCPSMKSFDPLAQQQQNIVGANDVKQVDVKQQPAPSDVHHQFTELLPNREQVKPAVVVVANAAAAARPPLPPVKLQKVPFQSRFQELQDMASQTGTTGTFGKTTVVREISTGKTFVMKFLKSQLEPGKVGKLKQEIELLLTLKHPQLIIYREHFESPTGDYFVRLEFFRNRSLTNLIAKHVRIRKTVQEKTIFDFCAQICLALKYLHEKGIPHRDVTPSNIFLKDESNSIKLGDLGVAKELLGSNVIVKSYPTSANYLAPELLSLSVGGLWSTKSDMFSLGCVLYELGALKKAFGNDGRSQLSSPKDRNAVATEMNNDGYSDAFIDLVANLLTTRPDQRKSVAQVMAVAEVTKSAQAYTN